MYEPLQFQLSYWHDYWSLDWKTAKNHPIDTFFHFHFRAYSMLEALDWLLSSQNLLNYFEKKRVEYSPMSCSYNVWSSATSWAMLEEWSITVAGVKASCQCQGCLPRPRPQPPDQNRPPSGLKHTSRQQAAFCCKQQHNIWAQIIFCLLHTLRGFSGYKRTCIWLALKNDQNDLLWNKSMCIIYYRMYVWQNDWCYVKMTVLLRWCTRLPCRSHPCSWPGRRTPHDYPCLPSL